MSEMQNGYVPDSRFTKFVMDVDSESDDAKSDLCPSFMSLLNQDERYANETLIGRGGLKEVYKAFDRTARQWVALARVREDRGLRCYDLFVHEAWLIASLSHPNIIKVLDVGIDENERPFFTMDLKRGTTLADLIAAKKSRTELLQIFQKVCDAVAYAHDQGIVHRDLKPENIQCDRFGEVLVCDWGAARSLKQIDSEDDFSEDLLPHRKQEHDRLIGQVRGTPGTVAPEQILEPESVHDERVDVYALGCILHTILCGEPPFKGSSEEILQKTANCKVPSLRKSYPASGVSESLDAVVLKAMALNPENRYESAIQLKQEVQQFLCGFSTNAEASSVWKELRLLVLRHKNSALISAAALGIIAISSAIFMHQIDQQQVATKEEQLRANILMENMNTLSSEYDSLFSETAVTKKELAQNLVKSANRALLMGIFENPQRAVNDAWRLVNMAITLDEKSEPARWMRYTIYCILLNYSEASRDVFIQTFDEESDLPKFVAAMPTLNFTRSDRPSSEEFIDILNRLYKESKNLNLGYIERVFSYQRSTDLSDKNAQEEFRALVSIFNNEQCTVNYYHEARSIQIISDADPFILVAKGEGSGTSILRYCPSRLLTLNLSGHFDLSHLDNLYIEVLDLSGSSNVTLTDSIYLPKLRKIKIRAGQINPEFLRSKIRSSSKFIIVEESIPDSDN